MQSYFKQILEAKNLHQLHIEQFSLESIDKLREAINIFRALRN